MPAAGEEDAVAQEHSSAGWEAVIGLEIHVQLRTATKLFCGCPNRFGGAANSHTCPVCLGLPGALPVPNREAVHQAVLAALALGCRVNQHSRFARKNYFYPDLPKGYQISQYEEPLAGEGRFGYELDGEHREVGILRAHLEEDAGKSIHEGMPRSSEATYVDLNRCGVPLLEIVTHPELQSAEQADAFLSWLRTTLLHVGVTDASMEEGSLRCDANISVRRRGEESLNPKSEVKNLNSFRFLRQALRHEQERQIRVMERGEVPAQGTRLWDERQDRTVAMRIKEEAHDYRYFPEPDLPPLHLEDGWLRELEESLGESPLERRDRWVSVHGLSVEDAGVLVEEPERARYFEALVAEGVDAMEAANWLRIQVLRLLRDRGEALDAFPVRPEGLAPLLRAVQEERVSANNAVEVLEEMAASGRGAEEVIAERGLEQITRADELEPVVAEVLGSHPDEVEAYRSGRQQVLGFLMGQVMRATRGKANPQLAQRLLRTRLEE